MVGVSHRGGRATVVPVVTRGDNIGVSKVLAREAPVVSAQGAIAVVEVAEMRGNARVISDITARGAPKVAAETVQAGVELLEHDGLGFDLAYLLGDDAGVKNKIKEMLRKRGFRVQKSNVPLGHLLKDKEALLDDLDALGMADDFRLFYNSERTLAEVAIIEVIGAVEVVKTAEGVDSTVVVEGLRSTSN